MKKKFFMLLVVLAGALTCVFAGCDLFTPGGGNTNNENEGHKTHIFDRKYADEKYLKTPATCSTKAVYYISCEICGEAGTETFEYGEKLQHTFTQEKAVEQYKKTPASCSAKAVYYKSCAVCGEAGTETFEYGEKLQHTFTQEKAVEQYKKSPASCTAKAVYYKSCAVCGEADTETFEYGTFGHNYVNGTCSICRASNLKYQLNDNVYTVVGIQSDFSGNEIVIPEKYDGLAVTGIGERAFYGCNTLTSITIPDGITNIGTNAFSGCSGITSINIPESVTTIGSYAFYKCSGLNGIIIPEGINNIGSRAFAFCSGLTSVTVNENNNYYKSANNCILSKDGTTLVAGCKNSTIPSGVTNIANSAFYGCNGLTNIAIPNSVTSIEDNAFFGCSGLTSITIPESVTKIGSKAFNSCNGLSAITVDENNGNYKSKDNCILSKDGTTLIAGCKNSIIPNGVTKIGGNAFFGCSTLTSITVPDSVTDIGQYAFSECSALTDITIPESVSSIGQYAFSACGLETITVDIKNINFKSANNCLLSKDGKTLIAGCKNSLIPDSVKTISDKAFYGCSGLISFTVPDGVTKIGDMAFENCGELTSLTVPKSLTDIGNHVFHGCLAITDITFNGTKAEWKAITKSSSWFFSSSNCTVTCTDGKLDTNGKEI